MNLENVRLRERKTQKARDSTYGMSRKDKYIETWKLVVARSERGWGDRGVMVKGWQCSL